MQFVVFWNIEWLKQRLQQRPLSGKEIYTYTFCWLALITLCLFEETTIDTPMNSALFACDLMILVFGVTYVWLCNGGKAGKQFFSRLISMGWVVTMRLLVFCLPLFFLLAFAPMQQSQIISDMAMTAMTVLLFWRLGYHIDRL